MDPGRTNGVGVIAKLLAAFAGRIVTDDQVAGEQKNLFPIIMHERCGRERSRSDAQQARAIAALAVFVERAGDDFLLEAGGIAGRDLPAALHVQRMKLFVAFVERHCRLRRLRPSIRCRHSSRLALQL